MPLTTEPKECSTRSIRCCLQAEGSLKKLLTYDAEKEASDALLSNKEKQHIDEVIKILREKMGLL